MGKYEPLRHFFSACEKARVTLSFAQIEEILGTALPASAAKYQAWWANNPEGHSHCRAWIDAGWRTENLDISACRVDFVRTTTRAPESNRSATANTDPWGALAGTVTIHDQEALTRPSGARWQAENDQP